MVEQDEGEQPPSLSPQRSSSWSFLSMAATSTEGLYAAAVEKGCQILPTTLTSRRSRSFTPTTNTPPILILIRLLHAEDIYLPVPMTTSLSQLLMELCAQQIQSPLSSSASSPTATPPLRLFIEEDRPAAPQGFVSALRSTATSLSFNRERVREVLVDWVNFIFLPEAVNREVRGRGIMSWTRENILPHLQDAPPPHITQATVVCLGGRRCRLELSSTATVQRLREVVQRQTGVPIERQRLVVAQTPPLGPLQRLFWSVAKRVYVVSCVVMVLMVAWVKWLTLGGGGENEETIKLSLQTTNGGGGGGGRNNNNSAVPVSAAGEGVNGNGLRSVSRKNSGFLRISSGTSYRTSCVEVRKDMTLGQLQHLIQLQHGDDAGLEGLILSSSTATVDSQLDQQQQPS